MTYKICNIFSFMAYFNSKKGGGLCQEKAHIRFSLNLKRKKNSKRLPGNIRHHIVKSYAPKRSSSQLKDYPTNRSVSGSTYPVKSSQNGENVSLNSACPGFRNGHGADARALFPPEIMVEIKALACQLPKDLGLPFSRLTRDEIAKQAIERGIVASISGTTVWRWLSSDAIRPWCYRSWIWPRDPNFETKAGRVLDLYHGTWENPLMPTTT
jgi:hypothetical protein